jgi:hypothetical protein
MTTPRRWVCSPRARPGAALERAALALLEATLDSRLAAEAGKCVATSGFAENAVRTAMSGGLVEAAAEDAVRHAVMQRVAKTVLASDAFDEVVERLLETDELWLLVDRVAASHPVATVLRRQTVELAETVREEIHAQARQRAKTRFDRVTPSALRRKER